MHFTAVLSYHAQSEDVSTGKVSFAPEPTPLPSADLQALRSARDAVASVKQRVGAAINSLTSIYTPGMPHVGVLGQMWLPGPRLGATDSGHHSEQGTSAHDSRAGADDEVFLHTRGAPFYVAGEDDMLTQFRMSCVRTEYAVQGPAVAVGEVGRVFLRAATEYTSHLAGYTVASYRRVEEARRCGVLSAVLMPVFDPTGLGGGPVAVVEVVSSDPTIRPQALVARLASCLAQGGLGAPMNDYGPGLCFFPGLGVVRESDATNSNEVGHSLVGSRAGGASRERLPSDGKDASREGRGSGGEDPAGAHPGGAPNASSPNGGAGDVWDLYGDVGPSASGRRRRRSPTGDLMAHEAAEATGLGPGANAMLARKARVTRDFSVMSDRSESFGIGGRALSVSESLMAGLGGIALSRQSSGGVESTGGISAQMSIPESWHPGEDPALVGAREVPIMTTTTSLRRNLLTRRMHDDAPGDLELDDGARGSDGQPAGVASETATPGTGSPASGRGSGGSKRRSLRPRTQAAAPTPQPEAVSADQLRVDSLGRRQGTGRKLTLADLEAHFHLGLKEAAADLGVCPTTLKRACRRFGIARWPRRQHLAAKQDELRSLATALEPHSPKTGDRTTDHGFAKGDVQRMSSGHLVWNAHARGADNGVALLTGSGKLQATHGSGDANTARDSLTGAATRMSQPGALTRFSHPGGDAALHVARASQLGGDAAGGAPLVQAASHDLLRGVSLEPPEPGAPGVPAPAPDPAEPPLENKPSAEGLGALRGLRWSQDGQGGEDDLFAAVDLEMPDLPVPEDLWDALRRGD
ncbi:unnamed protein product [Pedinophyceae sp. YPF-701]|nr:unnamed protein product [Pedinophyceae sp. YPF-701]